MIRTFAFAACLLAATPGAAQDAPPAAVQGAPAEEEELLGAPEAGFSLGGELNLMSDYRFRGISRSDEGPAAQAAVTVRHGSGIYAGARGTTLAGVDGFRRRDPAFGALGEVQLDLYAGYGTDLGGGFDLDAGAVYYVFAGGAGATDYVEPYASLSYLIGPVYATAGAKYAPAQRAIGGEDMLYLFGQVDVTVPFRPWSFTAQAGRQDWGAFGGYWTWSLAARHHVSIEGLPNAEVGLRYVDTDLPSARGQDAGLAVTVEISF